MYAGLLACLLLFYATGCSMIFPDVSHQPVIHNPFPQLSKVAIAPFFNQSDETTVDGRVFAKAYFAELQTVPGYEVVPLGVVEEAIIANQVDLSKPSEARRLANILGVDVVVIGAVTDFSPYYPPRCGLRVEWYAANAGYHEIPPGYGLPWGTPEEEFIPAPLVFESEFALAKAQLATQTPDCPAEPLSPPNPPQKTTEPAPFPGTPEKPSNAENAAPNSNPPNTGEADSSAGAPQSTNTIHQVSHESPDKNSEEVEGLSVGDSTASGAASSMQSEQAASGARTGAIGAYAAMPPGWPDERGFIPPPPSPVKPPCCPTNGPVMTHTRIYNGNDSDFTEALASYYHFRDDARFGGWQNYLARSEDFIRFCCHMHIAEMLSARGGASETRVVWRWSDSR
ncbi:MAG: hypothetical protein IT425_05365 [Pirellulales bacterium]|nr:hypothetical protein [Pirellulales bacterium]